MTIGTNPRYLEELRTGGGYGDAQDGGTDFEKNGDILTDGNITLKGILSVGSTPQILTDSNGNIDGSKVQAGTVDAAKMDASDDYTMNGLTLSGNELSVDAVGHYFESALTSGNVNKIVCSIDIGSASNFGGVALNIRVSGKTFNTSDLGMKQAYVAITKDGTPNYFAEISSFGPGNSNVSLSLRDMGSNVYEVWLVGGGTLYVSAEYAVLSGADPDFSVFGNTATGGTAVTEALPYDFGHDVLISGDLSVDGGDIAAGTSGGTRGVVTAWDGSGGNAPGCLKLQSPNGTTWHVFVEDDGTLKVNSALPTQNSDGSVVGTQT